MASSESLAGEHLDIARVRRRMFRACTRSGFCQPHHTCRAAFRQSAGPCETKPPDQAMPTRTNSNKRLQYQAGRHDALERHPDEPPAAHPVPAGPTRHCHGCRLAGVEKSLHPSIERCVGRFDKGGTFVTAQTTPGPNEQQRATASPSPAAGLIRMPPVSPGVKPRTRPSQAPIGSDRDEHREGSLQTTCNDRRHDFPASG